MDDARMTPLQRYEYDISQRLVSFDSKQMQAVEAFESLFGKLILADGNERRFISLIPKAYTIYIVTRSMNRD